MCLLFYSLCKSGILFGTVILHPSRTLTPFVAATKDRQYSKGFEHPLVNTNETVGMLKVMRPADLHVLMGAEHVTGLSRYVVSSSP